MRIQHNIMAMNAYRNYSNNTSALSKNLEKLSSGYKINRAGDDAAGLAISEKMRAQITGLETAQKNAKDGISLVQTAEGALTEVHDMLNRMVELASQSANGTYDDDVDRANLQKEFDALRTEIDRIADSSNFNGKKLLDGSLVSNTTQATNVPITIPTATATAPSTGKTVLGEAAVAAQTAQFSVDLENVSFTTTSVGVTSNFKISISGVDLTATLTGKASMSGADLASALAAAASGTTVTIGGFGYKVDVSGSKLTFTMTSGSVNSLTAASQGDAAGHFNVTVSLSGAGSGTLVGGNVNLGTTDITAGVAKSNGVRAHTNFTLTSAMVTDGSKLTIGDKTYVFKVGADSEVKASGGEVLVDLSDIEADDANFIKEVGNRLTQAGGTNKVFNIGHDATTGEITLEQKASDKHDMSTVDKIKELISMNKGDGGTATGGLTLQIGEDSESYNQLTVGVDDMHVAALGIDKGQININNQANAQAAVQRIKDAINTVSATRGNLGATQNRLEHTINNLSVMTENIQDAESNIRDVDVAEEMMAYTKNNILVQSAQAMLAQANQVPQGVLQLLQ